MSWYQPRPAFSAPHSIQDGRRVRYYIEPDVQEKLTTVSKLKSSASAKQASKRQKTKQLSPALGKKKVLKKATAVVRSSPLQGGKKRQRTQQKRKPAVVSKTPGSHIVVTKNNFV